MTTAPPKDWAGDAWDAYLREQVDHLPTQSHAIGSLRYLSLAMERGGRVWFPGCGVDSGPTLFAQCGCRVLATDTSSFAVEWQTKMTASPGSERVKDWQTFLERSNISESAGEFDARIENFLAESPDDEFDIIVSRRAFPQLAAADQARAASHFERCLRPGGHAVSTR